jgi:hypothetical protein
MKQFALVILPGAAVLAMCACETHQGRVAALQKDYNEAERQFRSDCTAELMKVRPALSSKCEAEDRRAKELWARLQTEQQKP